MANIMKNAQWFDENVVDVDFITANEDLTPKGRIHTPISSAEILTKFREKALNLGLRLVNEKGALKRDGKRFMYVADVEDDSHPDYALSIGFRNNSDKSLAFSGCCGSSVFICANGCMTSLIKPSKMRHTIGNVTRNVGFLDAKIDTIFERFLEDKSEIEGQIEFMRQTSLTDEIVGKFVRALNGGWKGDKFVKNPLIGSSNLMQILAELENPTLNRHDDSSVFRLHNAATYVTTHKMSQRNPSQAMMASRLLNNTIMNIIKPDFTPLGDVVDVEIEDAD
jgi:hypothetical protein